MMKMALVVTLCAAAAYGVQAQADPTVGAWTLNVAKTTYRAGSAPKSTTLVVEAAPLSNVIQSRQVQDLPLNGRDFRALIPLAPSGAGTSGQGVAFASHSVLANGGTQEIVYTATYDGKDAVVTGTPDYDRISLKKTANGLEGSRKRAGTVVQTFVCVVSAGGRTMTVTSTGTSAVGRVDDVQVYDRQ